MSQTATLSDFARTPFDGEALYCAVEAVPKTLAVVSSGLWELAIAGMMLVLAPIVLIALAGAFVVACLRIHASELGAESETLAHQPPVTVPATAQFNTRGRLLECTISDHRWN